MLVTNETSLIHNEQGRNAPHFEEIPFLAVQVGHPVPGVRQADEGQVVLCPVAAVGIGAIGPNGENFRVTRGEGRVVIAQPRKMSAAVWSHEAAQEGQNNIFLAAKGRKPHRVAVEIGQFKVGGNVSHQSPVVSYQLAVAGFQLFVWLFTDLREIRARPA